MRLWSICPSRTNDPVKGNSRWRVSVSGSLFGNPEVIWKCGKYLFPESFGSAPCGCFCSVKGKISAKPVGFQRCVWVFLFWRRLMCQISICLCCARSCVKVQTVNNAVNNADCHQETDRARSVKIICLTYLSLRDSSARENLDSSGSWN